MEIRIHERGGQENAIVFIIGPCEMWSIRIWSLEDLQYKWSMVTSKNKFFDRENIIVKIKFTKKTILRNFFLNVL